MASVELGHNIVNFKMLVLIFMDLYIKGSSNYVSQRSISFFYRREPVLISDLKSVGLLEIKLVAPMPEQLKTTAMHFYEVSRKPYFLHHMTPQRNALLWSGHVLGWVRNSNFRSLDLKLYSKGRRHLNLWLFVGWTYK